MVSRSVHARRAFDGQRKNKFHRINSRPFDLVVQPYADNFPATAFDFIADLAIKAVECDISGQHLLYAHLK